MLYKEEIKKILEDLIRWNDCDFDAKPEHYDTIEARIGHHQVNITNRLKDKLQMYKYGI